MLGDGDDLEAQRQHIGCQPGFDHGFGIDVVVLKVLETALEKAADGTQRLQVICHARVVE